MAHPRLQAVRQRYDFRCGYCGVTEIDVGGELTVDHFRPVSAGGDDSDDNLVCACVRCNQYKGALLPGATDMTQERHLLHPLQDNSQLHLRENAQTGQLEALTVTGTFHIEALHLNRVALIVNRQRRQLITTLQASLEQSHAEVATLEARLAQRDLYIDALEQELKRWTRSE